MTSALKEDTEGNLATKEIAILGSTAKAVLTYSTQRSELVFIRDVTVSL